jgi:hypothetical protein
MIGRVAFAFAFGALLAWLIAALMARQGAKKVFGQRR